MELHTKLAIQAAKLAIDAKETSPETYEKILESLNLSTEEAHGEHTEFQRGYYTAIMDVITQVPMDPIIMASLSISAAILAYEKLNFVNIITGEIL